jgi:hypothetical protein
MSQFRSNRHARTGRDSSLPGLTRQSIFSRRTSSRLMDGRVKPGHDEPYVHMNTFFRIEPCTPQLASTTWVTPKSAATDISAIASSSLMW